MTRERFADVVVTVEAKAILSVVRITEQLEHGMPSPSYPQEAGSWWPSNSAGNIRWLAAPGGRDSATHKCPEIMNLSCGDQESDKHQPSGVMSLPTYGKMAFWMSWNHYRVLWAFMCPCVERCVEWCVERRIGCAAANQNARLTVSGITVSWCYTSISINYSLSAVNAAVSVFCKINVIIFTNSCLMKYREISVYYKTSG